MKAAYLEEIGKMGIRDIPIPEIGPERRTGEDEGRRCLWRRSVTHTSANTSSVSRRYCLAMKARASSTRSVKT